ncbi:MAG: hypothetical protein AB3N23_16400 [Paracoccaceae bacterium]
MTSRSEFSAELAALQSRLGDRPAPTTREAPRQADAPQTLLQTLLGEDGTDIKRIEDLWDRLNAELDGLPEQKPLLTALAALGVGYLLGRVHK